MTRKEQIKKLTNEALTIVNQDQDASVKKMVQALDLMTKEELVSIVARMETEGAWNR